MPRDKTAPSDKADEFTPAIRSRHGIFLSIPSIILAIVFGLLFAFYLYLAISQSLLLSADLAQTDILRVTVGQSRSQYPWALIGPYLALPLVLYVVALIIGLRRSFLIKAGVFVIALATLSAASLTLVSLVKAFG